MTVSVGIGVGIVIGCVAIGFSAVSWRVAGNVPMIHDITTDPGDPPAFAALLPEREESWNGAEYGGPGIAEQQQKGYPDIVPIESALPAGEAFDRALAVARGMGWKVASADAARGRIEATDTTRWLRFKDDVVIRVRPGEGGASRVDVRSASRLGLSDLGKNAQRIREFSRRFAGSASAPGAALSGASPGSPGSSLPGGSPPSRLARSPGNG
jgi:uncharacterized protein (DUF1499 family)